MEIYARLKIPQILSNFLGRCHCVNETPPDRQYEMQWLRILGVFNNPFNITLAFTEWCWCCVDTNERDLIFLFLLPLSSLDLPSISNTVSSSVSFPSLPLLSLSNTGTRRVFSPLTTPWTHHSSCFDVICPTSSKSQFFEFSFFLIEIFYVWTRTWTFRDRLSFTLILSRNGI